MKAKEFFFKTDKAGFALGAVFLTTLTGCIGYVDRPYAGDVYQAPPVETTLVAQDDYVYYPGYDVYYSGRRHEYAYMDGGLWVSRPAPRGVSVEVLLASPSVRMDFHDSPAYHHAAVVQRYPRNWKPSGPNRGQKQERKDGRRD